MLAISALCVFTITFGFLLYKHGHVLIFLWDFPGPSEFYSDLPVYDLKSFGAPIEAGFSKRDITPQRGQWVAGFMPPHPGLAIHDRFWAKSLALRDKNGESIVIVSCDLIGLLPDELDKIFSLVKNIPRERIFITTTHTHSGPDTLGLWIWKNKKYMEFLRRQVASSIDESVVNISWSAIRFGQGEFSGYVNGREENPADPTVSVIQVLVKNLPVTIVNFACHPDVVQGLQFSADFPYFLSERIKLRMGGETMFIPAAIGGVQPATEGKKVNYFVRTLGEDLADAVYRIMKKPNIPKDAEISFQKMIVRAPFENNGLLRTAKKLNMTPGLLDKDQNITAEVGKIWIGPAEILTVPGELFPKIWQQVKPKMNGELKMIFGLTNGEFGYILLPEDYYSGKHKYHVSVSIGPTFGEKIYKALKQLTIDN